VVFYAYKFKTVETQQSESYSERGVVNAHSLEEAQYYLQKLMAKKNATLIKLKPVSPFLNGLYTKKITPSAHLSFFQSIAQLLGAGLPINDALAHSIPKKNTAIYQPVLQLLQDGYSLSTAFETSGVLGDKTLLTLLKQGEETGRYQESCQQIISLLQWQMDLKSKLRKSMIYPSILIVMSLILLTFLVLYVVPQLTSLFYLSGHTIPPETQLLLDIISVLPSIFVFLFMVLICPMIVMSLLIFLTPISNLKAPLNKPHHFIARSLFKCPLFGPLLKQSAYLQFFKPLSLLRQQNKTPLLESLSFVTGNLTPKITRRLFQPIPNDIQSGMSLSHSLEKNLRLDGFLLDILKIGEESSQLGKAFANISTLLESKLETTLKQVISKISPILMSLVGGILIFIIWSIILPLYSHIGAMDI